MSYLAYFLAMPVMASMALLLFYAVWVQSNRGGWWRVLNLVGIPGWLLDAALAHTLFALAFWRRPLSTERTFSDVVANLQFDKGWRGVVARTVKRLLNAIDPLGSHIP